MVISLPYIFQALYVLCFTRPRYQVSVYRTIGPLVSSPEPKAHGELIVYQSSRRPSVRASTLSNMNISATSKPIATKFYPKHHWGGGKAASGFWPDRIGTLVSMATDSSHRVLAGSEDNYKSLDEFEIGQNSAADFGVSCP